MAFLKINILGGTSDEVTIRIDGHTFNYMKDGSILKIAAGTHCFQLSSDGLLQYSLTQQLDQNDLITFGVIGGSGGKIIGEPRHNIMALSPEGISQLEKEISKKKAASDAEDRKSIRKKWTIAVAICAFFTIYSISLAIQGGPGDLVALVITLPIIALGVYKIIKNK